MAPLPPKKTVKHDFSPFIIAYDDGTVDRLVGTTVVPPSPSDPITGVASKDVVIDSSSGVWVRLYLPKLSDSDETKLPLVVYYHGGAFVAESAASPTCHNHLTSLSSAARALIVSVNYRLAPENPVPAAYHDSLAALKWVASHVEGSGPDEWLNLRADFDRVHVAGDSAGGNIAHHMGLRVRTEVGLRVRGLALVHASFWGSEAIGREGERPEVKHMVEKLWEISSPDLEVDDPLLNPFGVGAPGLRGLRCERVLVCVAEMCWFRDRDLLYYEGLKKSGWEGTVEVFETKGEGHNFHLFEPQKEKAKALLMRLVEFFNAR